MATIDERIAALEAKLKQEKAKKQQIEARRRAIESKKRRSEDTRRKILVGAAVLAKVERGEWPQDKLLSLMDAALTRADDRALFDLPQERSQDKAGGSEWPLQDAVKSPRSPAAPVQHPTPASPGVAQRRVDLVTRFEERDAVKAAGGEWDPVRRVWFVKPGLALAPFAQWLPSS